MNRNFDPRYTNLLQVDNDAMVIAVPVPPDANEILGNDTMLRLISQIEAHTNNRIIAARELRQTGALMYPGCPEEAFHGDLWHSVYWG